MTLAKRSELRAPLNDGESLLVPPLEELGDLVSANRTAAGSHFRGALSDLRAEARRELLLLAAQHTASYSDATIDFANCDGIALSGHQPELFHPGVWFKNFVLSAIGQSHNLAAINLVIDTEVCQATAIKIPSGTIDDPRIEEVQFDTASLGSPYESTTISDESLFRQFPTEVLKRLSSFGIQNPLCDRLWPHVLHAASVSSNIGFALAAGRHRLEQEIGLRTLELSLSKVCETKSFAMFAAHILQALPRFVEVYNGALVNYRKRNKLRSKTHPAPNLGVEEVDGSTQFETPFWIWSDSDTQRRPMFVSRKDDQLIIEGESVESENVDEIAERIFTLNQRGTYIRSRALLTTMYARLMLCDLFIHGIGGAKYDEVTDNIVETFFGIEAPQFCTASATHHLPIETPSVSAEQLHEIEQQIRDIKFHPERYLDEDASQIASDLSNQKKQLFASDVPAVQRKDRHRKVEAINASLRELAQPVKDRLISAREQLATDLERKQLLTSREFSFCLFPAGICDALQSKL